MAIDPEKFLNWVETRFDDFVVRGNEIKINSIFMDDDHKRHLWCNPLGGKKEREYGVFHCWRTEKRGSLVTLVMLVDKCSYEEAVETLDACDTSMVNLEAKLDAVFNPTQVVQTNPLVDNKLRLPPNTFPIDEMHPEDFYRITAETYLLGRKLSTTGLMICTEGGFYGGINYSNRIIIPYYDQNGKLIYFNARYLGNKKDVIRYMGPPKEVGIGKEHVLFIPIWPQAGSTIYLTEGEFDALAICESSKLDGELMYVGAFGGKNLSDFQVEILQPYHPVLCLDADKAGKQGLMEIAKKLKASGKQPEYIRPPVQYKDWNKMLERVGEKILVHYIKRNKRPLDEIALAKLLM